MSIVEQEVAGGPRVEYPDSDGQPMADNTVQFRWIQLLQFNLDRALEDFVAGDLLWYPVQGEPRIRVAPDVLVALGRPKGDRGSYRTWEEDGVVPQVVVEVLSPSNSMPEMMRKLELYRHYGVQEFWVVDPDKGSAFAFMRGQEGKMELTGTDDGFESPLLGVRFVKTDDGLSVLHADGTPFRTPTQEWERAERLAERAEAEQARAEAEQARAERLAARLRELGIDPDEV